MTEYPAGRFDGDRTNMEVIAMGNRAVVAAMTILSGLGALAWSQASTDTSKSRTRWEYKYEKMETADIKGTSDGSDYTVVKLDLLGNDGWELVSMQAREPSEGSIEVDKTPTGVTRTDYRYFDCYFKRPR